MEIREVLDVPMSRVVSIDEMGFTIRVKKFLFGWKERRFLYLWFPRIGGPVRPQSAVIGQITQTGTLLRFYSDLKNEGHEQQVKNMMLIAQRIAEAIKVKQQVEKDLATGNLTDHEKELLRRFEE